VNITYSVTFSTAAARQLTKLDPPARLRVSVAIDLLADNPRPPGATPLVGGRGAWRVRTGDYRIIYEIADRALRVWVIAVDHRRDVFEYSLRRAASEAGAPIHTPASDPRPVAPRR